MKRIYDNIETNAVFYAKKNPEIEREMQQTKHTDLKKGGNLHIDERREGMM